VLTCENGGKAFIASTRRLALLARQGEAQSRHGRSTTQGGRRRAAAVRQWRKAIPPSGRWRSAAWPGRGATDVTYRSGWERRTDRWTRAGLGVRVRPVRRHDDAAGREQRGDVVRADALPVFQFSIALFDRRLLKISKQKWTKGSIAKL
jgi:hypothetical protein